MALSVGMFDHKSGNQSRGQRWQRLPVQRRVQSGMSSNCSAWAPSASSAGYGCWAATSNSNRVPARAPACKSGFRFKIIATNEHEWTRIQKSYSCVFVFIRGYFFRLLALLRFHAPIARSLLPGIAARRFDGKLRPRPVLSGAIDTLNPSVIRFRGEYLNLYSEYDGHTWHTALATSNDGVKWEKRGRVLSPEGWEGNYIAANGAAVAMDDRIFYWYQAGDPPRIALARSNDGRAWTKDPKPVVPLGPRGSFDERGVADPYVIRAGDSFYLLLYRTSIVRGVSSLGIRTIDRRSALVETAHESDSRSRRTRSVR